jgi:hypothetical protein
MRPSTWLSHLACPGLVLAVAALAAPLPAQRFGPQAAPPSPMARGVINSAPPPTSVSRGGSNTASPQVRAALHQQQQDEDDARRRQRTTPDCGPSGPRMSGPRPDEATRGVKREGDELEKAVKEVKALGWHKSLGTAREEARSSGKPILLLQTLGDLTGFA